MPDTDPRLEKTAPAGTGPIIASAPGAAWIPVLSLLASMASAALVLLDGSASIFSDDRITFFLSLLLSAAALVLATRAKRKLQYYLALAGRILMFLLALFFAADHPVASLLLLAGILAEFSCFEPYPINLAETLGIVACALVVGLFHAARDSTDPLLWLQRQAPLLLFGVPVSLFGCHMTREAFSNLTAL